MGAHMSSNVLARFGSLTVFDVRTEAIDVLVAKGATAAESAQAVGAACDTVFVSLPTPDVIPPVLEALIAGGAIRTFVDLSTTGPTMTGVLAARAAEAGIGYLDSPVSGGVVGARDGTLTIMASGDPAIYEDLRFLLEALGKNVVHVGPTPGQAQLTKLINNLLSATAVAITAEAVALGVKGGLDPKILLEVLNTASGRNTATMDKFPRTVLPRTFDFGFRLELMTKDVNLCLTEADRRKVPMLVGSTVQQLFELANATSRQGADLMELTLLIESWAGVTIGGDGAA
jgi:3-hydroxyisobutyrate dehydrogenase-like beta-hydroxyacid dehydrogenase